MTDRAPWQRETPAQLSAQDLSRFESFLATTIRAAGELTLDYFRADTTVENKAGAAGFDPVTQADRAAESFIRERIAAAWPGHGILGEEHGFEPGAEALTWIIDPIDGTRAFITGALHWGVLVALFDGKAARLGAMYQPYSRELFMGGGSGAWLEHQGRRRALRTRPCPGLGRASLCCTTPDMFAAPGELDAFSRLRSRALLCRYGGDCYSYCMLAMGQVDLVVESSLQAYDIQALIPIVEAAGGRLTDWDGDAPVHGGAVVAVGDPALLEPVLACLNSSR